MLGLSDLGIGGAAGAALALALPALVAAFAWAHRAEIRERRGASVAFVATLLFAVVVSVFVVSKFSHRGIQRPRYLLALHTPGAVASGRGLGALARRSLA